MALPPEAAGQAADSHGLAGGGAGHKRREKVDHVVIRFAGDSGDGMQLAGTQFTTESALAGNDIATLPDFPAEIRAPAGTLAGVSGFQVNFSSSEIFTAGDEPNVLVAMNPAALKANLDDVPPNGVIIADVAAFSDANLKRAGFTSNPLTDHSLDKYQVFQVDVTQADDPRAARLGTQQPGRDALPQPVRARPGVVALSAADRKHGELARRAVSTRLPDVLAANVKALKAGYNYGETTETFASSYVVDPARIAPGFYRNITGNSATALGFVVAACRAKRPLFLGSYPITPASDVLHDLAGFKNFPRLHLPGRG